MKKVADFGAYKQRRLEEQAIPRIVGPHLEGPAICTACKHEWEAQAPLGAIALECPSCTTERGLFKWPAITNSDPIWVCVCGCHVMTVTPAGIICYTCGLYQNINKD